MPRVAIAAPDGALLSVRKPIRAAGPWVILLDGIGCDGYIWRYLRPALERNCRVVHLQYRGHGLSEVPADHAGLTIEQCARDAWTALRICGFGDGDRAVLVGHSMGVQVALEAAHQHIDQVAGLVPICGAFERPLDTFQGSDVGARILPVLSGAALKYQQGLRNVWQRLMPTEWAYKLALATEINAQMIRKEDFLPYFRHMARMDPLVFLAYLQDVASHSARPYLGELAVPALVVSGQRDHFTPDRLQKELAQALPDSELCEIPGGSHTAPLELPELLELRLEDWGRRRGLGLL
ncbi:MAG: alpha/beta hydrolase [Deltaproteobacteria bacterium]|nr:alpha/beta hydrolase [Deltaproteobacteria bacterium]